MTFQAHPSRAHVSPPACHVVATRHRGTHSQHLLPSTCAPCAASASSSPIPTPNRRRATRVGAHRGEGRRRDETAAVDARGRFGFPTLNVAPSRGSRWARRAGAEDDARRARRPGGLFMRDATWHTWSGVVVAAGDTRVTRHRASRPRARGGGWVDDPAAEDYALDIDLDAQVVPGGGVRLTAEQKRRLNRFWAANGVKSAPHRKNLVGRAEHQGLFRDPPRLLERMVSLEDSLWRALGIAEIDMGVIVGRYPKVLFFDADFLVERLRLLRDLLPSVNLKRIIERNPMVLSMDMTCTLPAKMRELSVLLPHTDVIHLIETHPKILSSNVSNAVSKNLANLKSLMAEVGIVEAGVEVMVAYNPRLLNSDVTGTLRRRMEHVESMSPGTFARYKDKPASVSRMLCASEKALDRIAYLKEVHPSVTSSEIRTVNLPAAKFKERYPDFDRWQEGYREKHGGREGGKGSGNAVGGGSVVRK